MLDEAGLTARQIANQLGHSRPSLTQVLREVFERIEEQLKESKPSKPPSS
jgi:predicted DNA binding protein